MYYSNGNYEAFAKPLKPTGVDSKSAHIIGAGLAGLSAACFLIRDGQMPGAQIHIYEELDIAGGACDGLKKPEGFVIRGGREMENHFECLWDLFRSIPSLNEVGSSVLDEFYQLNKRDPNISLQRATIKQGQDAHTDGKFGLSDKAALEVGKLIMTPDKKLYDKKIEDVFDEFFDSNLWMYWRTMFAFEAWHSALEMKLYMLRFIHHIDGLPDFSALKFAPYNTYEAFILPMMSYLKEHKVNFIYNTAVKNVKFDIKNNTKIAAALEIETDGKPSQIKLGADDLVFTTLGSCTESSSLGDHHSPAPAFDPAQGIGGTWELWENIAAQDKSFGNPKKFYADTSLTNWESATITVLDKRIAPFVEKIAKRSPYTGLTVTGSICTAQDSSWLLSWNVGRQPIFKGQQSPDEFVVWFYGLFSNVPGDYIKKPMTECTGEEIASEWLYHIGVPTNQIAELAATSINCVPCYMPYITAFFMPRTAGDRPAVVPEGSSNFAFIGEFVETERDTVFTTEFAVRTAMEAVYTLLDIDRGVPEVFASRYDIRCLLDATAHMLDGRKITDVKIPGVPKHLSENLAHKLVKRAENTEVGELLKKYKVV